MTITIYEKPAVIEVTPQMLAEAARRVDDAFTAGSWLAVRRSARTVATVAVPAFDTTLLPVIDGEVVDDEADAAPPSTVAEATEYQGRHCAKPDLLDHLGAWVRDTAENTAVLALTFATAMTGLAVAFFTT